MLAKESRLSSSAKMNGNPTEAKFGLWLFTKKLLGFNERQAAKIFESTSSPTFRELGAVMLAPQTSPLLRKSFVLTKPDFSSKVISSPIVLPKTEPWRPRTKAVPTLGCPANGSSSVGVKIRTLAVFAGSLGGNTNVTSE